jgi:hypothetical protein
MAGFIRFLKTNRDTRQTEQTIPLEAGNLPNYPYLFEALGESACGGISNAEPLTHLLSVHYRL